jgi:hypothetical protein
MGPGKGGDGQPDQAHDDAEPTNQQGERGHVGSLDPPRPFADNHPDNPVIVS